MDKKQTNLRAAQNRADRLFDEKFMTAFFRKRLLRLYPDFKSIKKISIRPVKKHIWSTAYHVVIEYRVTLAGPSKKREVLPIYCTAHSEEPRKKVYDVMKALWNNYFSSGYRTCTHPLFYSKYYNAVFYRGVEGHTLFHYIKHRDYPQIIDTVSKTGGWLAKLHKLPASAFGEKLIKKSLIKDVVPGKKKILRIIANNRPQYCPIITDLYQRLEKKEAQIIRGLDRLYVVHGDAQPENVIRMGRKKIAMIDFTDLALNDFAKDLGSFLHQLDYMLGRKTGDWDFTRDVKSAFLQSYYGNSNIKRTQDCDQRTDFYYTFYAFRNAIYFLSKHEPDLNRTNELLRMVCEYFKIPLSAIPGIIPPDMKSRTNKQIC